MFGLGKGGSLGTKSIPRRVRAILNKYGATMLLPGVAEPILGPELVGSAWVDASAAPATATFSAGVLTLNATGGTSRGRTSITTVANRTYRVTARKLNAGSDCTLDIGTSAGGSQLSVNNTVGTSGVSITFVATTTQTWLNFYRGATSVTDVTDISVREILGYNHTRFGYQAGNYRESTGQTLAAADQQVGLVVDAARVPGPELIQVLNFASSSQWDMTNTASFTANTWSMGSSGGPMLVTVPGETYSVSFPWSATAYGTFALYNGTGIGAPVVAQQSGTSGTLTLIFTAAANRAYFRFSAGGTVAAGAISVRELPGILASQATSGYQSYLRQSGGVNSWQFDGVDDRLSLSAVPFQMSDDHFVVAGINPSSSANDPAIFSVTSTTNNNPVISLGLLGTGAPRMWWRDDAGTFIQRVADDNLSVVGSNVVLSGVKSGSTGRFRKNGIPRGSIALSIGAATFNAATVGAFTRSTVTSFMNGHIHGVIFGKGAISDSELLTLERFMASLQGRSL